eukprot:GHVO01024404.1.p1 GENE.GHVO01024404.1~~GHVO01024404.1.p1  ORF type:complete len:165 (+),score=7.08 GHVO01024404.1:614-1108(+)
MISLVRASMVADKTLTLLSPNDVKLGDLVVYQLSEYERRKDQHEKDLDRIKYTPSWSLPCRVMKVQDQALVVKHLWGPEGERSVPRVRIQILGEDVPKLLTDVNLRAIERSAPIWNVRHAKHALANPGQQSWDSIVENAVSKERDKAQKLSHMKQTPQDANLIK